MPKRVLVAQDTRDNQVLRVDYSGRFIVCTGSDWQMLFNSNSELTTSFRVLKLAAELPLATPDKFRLTAYLFNTLTGSVDNATSCEFKIFVAASDADNSWADIYLGSLPGVIQNNQYFFAELPFADLAPYVFDGSSTILIDAYVMRMKTTYRDRLYVNHLGVYNSIEALRNTAVLKLTSDSIPQVKLLKE